MKGGVVLIIAAVATYLVAVGCALWPADSAGVNKTGSVIEVENPNPVPAPKYDGLPYRGIVLQVGRVEPIELYEKSIDDIAATGADTVEFVVDSRQENASSSVIFIDLRTSPTIEKLVALMQYAKSKKLRVVLMPIVLLEHPGSDWRGTIKPENWDNWFESYRQMLAHYASAAEAGHIDVFIVGSELVSAERYKEDWLRVISVARGIYHGLLSYSANWDHYKSIPFWDHLDIISTNSYYKLGENKDVKVDEIITRWRAIQKDLLPWVRSQHKPYMFTEVGWFSVANAADEPWDYTKESIPVDLELQRKLYEGFFKSWYGQPELGGFMIWEWTPNISGPRDRGYTPEGKPAERVMREWLAKPAWKVTMAPRPS